MKRCVTIAGLTIGQGAPVRVESMLKTRLTDTEACLAQLAGLKEEGCELVRVALPKAELKESMARLVKQSPLPIMADIHFDPAIALAALEAGCPSIRVNPGNMGSPEKLAQVIETARERGAVIRIGANSGSVSPHQLQAAGGDRGAALALAVSEQMEMLLAHRFYDVIVSAKSTDVDETLRANVLLQRRYGDFPFHVGMTESGSGLDGIARSSAGLSRLFAAGIGDTMRVSLSQDPADEVRTAYSILRALKIRHRGGQLISCPTCGRRQLEVASLVPLVKPLLKDLPDGFTLAVMGCEVNGPQEARHAHLGIAGSPGGIVIFQEGRIVERVASGSAERFIAALSRYLPNRQGR